MRITSHSVGAVIVTIEEDYLVLCARMKYTRERAWTFRHMMETGEANEMISETLRNGLLSEVAKDPENFEYRLLKDEPILVSFKDDQSNQGGTHIQVFFLVEILRGELRDIEKPDGDATMGPIDMTEIAGYIRATEGKTVPIHVQASKAALASLAADPCIFRNYQDLILSSPVSPRTDEEQQAIDAYPFKW